jgi:hypothetical protein
VALDGAGTERRVPAIRSELAIGVLIFLIATAVGIRSVQLFRQAGGEEYFYQPEFGPAVMMACHRGLVNPDVRNAPVLAAFLAGKTDGIACADVASVPTTSMSQFQAGSLYLEGAVGLTWMATGVSWSRIALLDGALFGAVAALTYGVLRVALRRVLAVVTLVLSVTSTPNLMLVPQLRDYAKGPFLLAVILIMGVLVVGPADRRRAIGLSALCGGIVGVGVGVRTDVFIAVVPFLAAVALLLPRAVSIRTRAIAVAAFVAAFLAVALPVFRGYTHGGNTGHVVLLGFAPDFGRILRIEPSIYEVIGLYNDSYGFSTINGYGNRFENRRAGSDLSTADYDRAAVGYLRQIALTFPADIVIRAVAAMRVLPRYFLDSSLYPPIQLQSRWVESLYGLRNRIWWRLAPLAFVALVAATFAVALVSTRAAWLIVLVMFGFGATAAVQFHERHFYYLEFLPWLAFALLAETAIAVATGRREATREQLRSAALVLIVVAAGTAAVIVSTRAYQQRTAERLFERYQQATHTPLSLEARPAGENRTLFAAKEWLAPLSADAGRVFTRFLSIRLNDVRCDARPLPVTIRYDAKEADADLSQQIDVPVRPHAGRPTELFVPVYDRADESIRFRGVEVPSDRAGCFDAVDRVDGLEHAPLLLTTILAADWRQERLYQRLR